jgi:hypothetical protein
VYTCWFEKRTFPKCYFLSVLRIRIGFNAGPGPAFRPMRIRIWFRIRDFDDQKLEKINILLGKIYIFFDKNLRFTFPWLFIKDVQAIGEAFSPSWIRIYCIDFNDWYCTGCSTFLRFMIKFFLHQKLKTIPVRCEVDN